MSDSRTEPRWVLSLDEVDRARLDRVGGKAAHLGELSTMGGFVVPAGFCVTTDAFRRVVEGTQSIAERLKALGDLGPDDTEAARTLSAGGGNLTILRDAATQTGIRRGRAPSNSEP